MREVLSDWLRTCSAKDRKWPLILHKQEVCDTCQWQTTRKQFWDEDYEGKWDVFISSRNGIYTSCQELLLTYWSHAPLLWHHNGQDGVSNHQPDHCVLNRYISKKTSKLRVTGFCAGNPPGTGEFPAQMASCTENVSIWWCHHAIFVINLYREGINDCHFHCHCFIVLSNGLLAKPLLNQ